MWNFLKVVPKTRKVKIVRKTGVIYNNPTKIGKVMFYTGSGIVLLAVGALIYLYQPLMYSWWKYETKFKKAEIKLTEEIKEVEPISSEFTIRIPKIGAQSDVVADVSPYNPKEYLQILDRNLVAQSKTSFLPGSGVGKMTYIFAHSTQQDWKTVRKNSVFYLLDELDGGDAVIISYHGKKYIYQVYQKRVVTAKETEYLNYKEDNKEILILQTCWPLGTNWKRLLVFAERV